MQLGQFDAPQRRQIGLSEAGGFVEEPFRFAVVIWTVHSALFGRRPGRTVKACAAYVEINVPDQAAVQSVPGAG